MYSGNYVVRPKARHFVQKMSLSCCTTYCYYKSTDNERTPCDSNPCDDSLCQCENVDITENPDGYVCACESGTGIDTRGSH